MLAGIALFLGCEEFEDRDRPDANGGPVGSPGESRTRGPEGGFGGFGGFAEQGGGHPDSGGGPDVDQTLNDRPGLGDQPGLGGFGIGGNPPQQP
jgi:hypothetical protein